MKNLLLGVMLTAALSLVSGCATVGKQTNGTNMNATNQNVSRPDSNYYTPHPVASMPRGAIGGRR